MKLTKKWMTFSIIFLFVFLHFSTVVRSDTLSLRYDPSKTTLFVGESYVLKAVGENKKVHWSSDNKNATVNKKGKVKAKRPGKVTITARSGNAFVTCEFTILKKTKQAKLTELEKSLLKKIKDLKKKYPQGTKWGDDKNYFCKVENLNGFGCVALALEISDYLFGEDVPFTKVDDLSDIEKRIRIGDIVRMEDDTHSVVIIDRDAEGVTLVEGDFTYNDEADIVYWGSKFTYEELKKVTNYYHTRHPREN